MVRPIAVALLRMIRRWYQRRGVTDLSGCPYYLGTGKCYQDGGWCWISGEPRCVTDEPLEGWPAERWRRRLGIRPC